MCFRGVQSILGDGVRRHTGFSHYGVLVVCDERWSTKWPVSALLLRRTPFRRRATLNATTAAFLTRLPKGWNRSNRSTTDTLSALTSFHPPSSLLLFSAFSSSARSLSIVFAVSYSRL